MSEKNEWKLVPVEPTDDMEAAAEDDYEQTGATFPRWKSAYAAMLNAAPSAPGDAQDEQRAQDGKRPDLDWIEGVCVTDTVGSGWCVRIDGTDIFEDVNRYGCKGRRSFQIADGLASKQLAQRAAVEWLTRQLAALDVPAAGDALDAARYRWLRDQEQTDSIAIVMKDKHFDESRTCAENIDNFIDAALAAQIPQQGEA